MIELVPKTISLLLLMIVSIKILFIQIVNMSSNSSIKNITIFILTFIGISVVFYICYCWPLILVVIGYAIIIVCIAYAVISLFVYLSQYLY